MDNAIIVKCSGGIKRADNLGLVGRTDGIVVDHGRARLGLGIGRVVLPGAIGDDMDYIGLIDQRDVCAFFDGDATLREIIASQANGIVGCAGAIVARNRTGNKK